MGSKVVGRVDVASFVLGARHCVSEVGEWRIVRDGEIVVKLIPFSD
jgi:hypothetical protein